MLTDHTIRGNIPPARVVSAPPVRSALPRFLLQEVLVLSCMRKVCTPYKHCSVFRVQYIAIVRSILYSIQSSKHRQAELNSH